MKCIRNGRHLLKLSRFPRARRKNSSQNIKKSIRKDVEQAFSVLQARFTIVRGPTCLMDQKQFGVVMRACVILHNMIVKDERDNYELVFKYNVVESTAPESIVNYDQYPCYETYFRRL